VLGLRGANLYRFKGKKELREYRGQSKCRMGKRQMDPDGPMGNEEHYSRKGGVFPAFCLRVIVRVMLLSMTPLGDLKPPRVVNGAPPQ
jgi:hypothetical protein